MSATNAFAPMKNFVLVYDGVERVIVIAQTDSEETLCRSISTAFNLQIGCVFALQNMATDVFIGSVAGSHLWWDNNNIDAKYRVVVHTENPSIIEGCRLFWRSFVLPFFVKLNHLLRSRRHRKE